MTTVNAPRTAQLATAATLADDGATVSAVTFDAPTWGYAVATEGREETYVLALDPRQTTVELLAILEGYVRKHRAILATPGYYLGTWLHEGRLYLDVSQSVRDRVDAIRLGRQRSQIAIWDFVRAIEVTLATVDEELLPAEQAQADSYAAILDSYACRTCHDGRLLCPGGPHPFGPCGFDETCDDCSAVAS